MSVARRASLLNSTGDQTIVGITFEISSPMGVPRFPSRGLVEIRGLGRYSKERVFGPQVVEGMPGHGGRVSIHIFLAHR